MNCIRLHMKRMATLLGCLLLYVTGWSQFNDSTHYHVNLAATGTINKTNDADSYILNNTLGFDINKKTISLNFYNNWIYGENLGVQTNNDFTSTLNFDLFRATRTLYYWGLASYTSSYSLKINNQFQTGAGIGVNAVRKKNAELVISDGILFESSNLYDGADKSNYITARNSLRVKYHWVFWKTITLDGMHFWQPALNDISNYIVRSSNSLTVSLNKWLRIGTSLTYNKFSKTNSENMLINFGVTVDKYF